MKLLDLFAGIGGFSLAAHWMGWETIGFVEWDDFCQKVLRKNFPGIPIWGNIVEFNKKLQNGEIITDTEGTGFLREEELENNKENNGTGRGCNTSNAHKIQLQNEYVGQPDILTGGFPCQPFSQAGKRMGKDDDRYLWPEMLRTISILKPSYVVGENVAGLVSMEDGKTLERILSDLEAEGYTVETFIIPACSIGAWHRRDRIWIVGYSEQQGLERRNRLEESERLNKGCKDVSDTISRRQSRQGKYEQSSNTAKSGEGEAIKPFNGCRPEQWAVEPPVGRVAHGVPGRVDRLKSLGNAIVPQVAYQIFKAIDENQT